MKFYDIVVMILYVGIFSEVHRHRKHVLQFHPQQV